MSRPPKTTLILSNLQSNTLIGIDTHFFTVNELLKGIKLIPEGIHLFHYSESAESGESMRYGKWFQCKDEDILTVELGDESCHVTANVNAPPNLSEEYSYMVKYPETKNWEELVNFVDSEAVEEYTPDQNFPISTATPLKEENMVLLDILRERDPKQKFQDQEGQELNYTILQNKLTGPITGDRESSTTQNSLDKSWYLQQLFGHDPELLLAELQLLFVHFIILGNLCSCTQWLSLMKLVLLSSKYLKENVKFSMEFLDLLRAQLTSLPSEYISSGMEVVDMEVYLAVMENFSYIFSGEKWGDIKNLNQTRFGITLEFSKEVDADNFEVYDLNDYDENDEDAPAVVT